MGNCGTREESAVVTNAQVQQLSSLSSSVKSGAAEKRQNHSRSISDLSDPSTPRNFEDARKNAVLYTHVIAFTLFELETITKSFRSDYILGEGGFGTVYKGYIDENVRVGLKSLPVAVKVLNKEGLQGHREWLTESMSSCSEEALKTTCSGKQLFHCLGQEEMLIALGAAKGLAFLHNAERPVIYRDFKTSNILLDSDYTAKLSDFGLAKAGPQGDETHVSTRVMGTYGYAAPEYVMTGHLTARSDVYSFGVVLLELLTGRRSVDKTRPSKEQKLGQHRKPAAWHTIALSQTPKQGPLMSDVVETLEPLQSCNDPSESSLGGPFAMTRLPDYRMRQRFSNNVGPGAICRSPNPNISPGGPAACRVR
ncbi:hypothetical protein M0R45_028723 [Rubus argutus]|uniref:Protein kinase domain-containing protein n=1 Tax=Rubus argutus TaxID=59490 RepID=A0AAW1W875_RUBAR